MGDEWVPLPATALGRAKREYGDESCPEAPPFPHAEDPTPQHWVCVISPADEARQKAIPVPNRSINGTLCLGWSDCRMTGGEYGPHRSLCQLEYCEARDAP
jgi:hypothetical protein